MLDLAKKKVTKQKLFAQKNPRNAWDFNADNIAISKLVERKANSKYLIGYLNKVIRLLVFLLLMVDEGVC